MGRSCEGRVALVTGASRGGTGTVAAIRLAAEGAKVAITARTREGLDHTAAAAKDAGGDVLVLQCDLADPDGGRDTLVTRTEAELGPVDILVNCAGGDIGAKGGKPSPNNALEIPFEDIQTEVNNNLIGTMLVCQAFMVPMRERGAGTVINIASAAAHMGCSPEAVYATLKAAVVHWTRCLAKELIHDGVRVNCVSPGPTKSARFQATRPLDPQRMDSSQKSFNRYAEPSEIADAVAFLAGPHSRFINGQVLRVDGGITLYPG